MTKPTIALLSALRRSSLGFHSSFGICHSSFHEPEGFHRRIEFLNKRRSSLDTYLMGPDTLQRRFRPERCARLSATSTRCPSTLEQQRNGTWLVRRFSYK